MLREPSAVSDKSYPAALASITVSFVNVVSMPIPRDGTNSTAEPLPVTVSFAKYIITESVITASCLALAHTPLNLPKPTVCAEALNVHTAKNTAETTKNKFFS